MAPIVLTPTSTSTLESLLLDPEYDDAANAELELHDAGNGIKVIAQEFAVPDPNPVAASSFDTEGEPVSAVHYPNREIALKVRVAQATHEAVDASVVDLQGKVGKINRERGTLGRVTAGGGTITFDLQTASIDVPQDWQYALAKSVECTLKFTALPFGRKIEAAATDHAETTLPVLIFVDTGPDGDVLALSRLVIDEDSGADQWMVLWGIQSRYYSSATSAGLLWQAEDLTAQGGSATNAGPTGKSGTGVMRSAALSPSPLSILSTQATGGGAHLSNVGDFRVYARCQLVSGSSGTFSLALQWGEGDLRQFTRNAPLSISTAAVTGQWMLVDLGTIHTTKAVAGTQRWEGRLLASSTVVGDQIDVDHLFLLPVTEGAAKVQGVMPVQVATVLSARDEFDQAAGNLNAKTAAVGGAWATAGAATDFAVEATGHTVTRATTADGASPANGRVAAVGTGIAAQVVQADIKVSALVSGNQNYGVVSRYVDASNFAYAALSNAGGTSPTNVFVGGLIGGSPYSATGLIPVSVAAGAYYTLRIAVDAAGRTFVWWFPQGGAPRRVISTLTAALATGGTLASGKFGLYDWNDSGVACTRNYDNFQAFPLTNDAAVFASQSLTIYPDRARREDSGGTLMVQPSSYEGSYIHLPPAGRENRSCRTLVKACRGPEVSPGVWLDPAIDDISARHYITPRHLVVPDA